jgi:hypothetical protein
MAAYNVATGAWYDHSLSGGSAWMLTLDVVTGAYLISGLATFVALVGGQFWAIVAYAIHQVRATESPRDGLHHQHQLIYRNCDAQLTAVWYVFRIALSWRKRVRRNILRTIAFLLPPLLCFVAFTIAGIYSSNITSPSYTANRVLVASKNCGTIFWNGPASWNSAGTLIAEGDVVWAKWFAGRMSESRNYARSCYTEGSEASVACNVLPVQKLPYTTKDQVVCPFATHRCLGSNTAYQLATPWLNSHEHFGINAPASERVSLRRLSTCSVLDIRDVTYVNDNGAANSYYSYRLGPLGTPDDTISPTYYVSDGAQNDNFPYKVMYMFSLYMSISWSRLIY